MRGSSNTLPHLVPPLRFSLVEEGIFRGAYPSQINFRFLKRLQLCSVISLLPEEPTEDFLEWCRANRVQCHHQRVNMFKDELMLTHERAAELLQLIVSADRQPVYLHCLDGVQVTGVIIMCLRKLQRWSMPPVSNEFARHLLKGSDAVPLQPPAHVLQFVNNFRPELEFTRCLPDRVPFWLAVAVGLVAPGIALDPPPLRCVSAGTINTAADAGKVLQHPSRSSRPCCTGAREGGHLAGTAVAIFTLPTASSPVAGAAAAVSICDSSLERCSRMILAPRQ